MSRRTAWAAAHNSGPKGSRPRRPDRRQDGAVSCRSSKSSLAALTLGAIGVVYGDIGTSVLYAVKEVFGTGHVPFTDANVYGILSIFFWTLTVIVSIKYVRAGAARRQQRRGRPDRDAGAGLAGGEGQAQAAPACCWSSASSAPRCSTATASSRRRSRCCRRSKAWRWCRPRFNDWVIPLTLVVLFCLFAVQKRGTGGIGRFFGPITLVWFVVIAALGVAQHRAPPGDPEGAQPALRAALHVAATRAPPSSSWARWCCASPAPRRCTPTWATSARSRSAWPGSRW